MGACKRGERGAADTTMSTMDNTGAAMSDSARAAATAMSRMTDAQIFARLTAANEGEIAAGKMAASKATNADVKAFARQMIADHTKMLNDGNALAKRLNVTPDMAAADSIRTANGAMADQLRAAPKGMAFDSAYVNGQVMGHQATLDMIRTAEDQAQNADLKQALSDAAPMVEKHLDRIKDIQGKLK